MPKLLQKKKKVETMLMIMVMHYNFSLIPIRLKKCLKMSSVHIYPLYNMFLNSVSLKKYAIKLLIVVLLYLILFLVCIRLKTHSGNGIVEVERASSREEVSQKVIFKIPFNK